MMFPRLSITQIMWAIAIAMAASGWLSMRAAYINKGEARAAVKIEKNNAVLRKKAQTVTRKSLASQPGGVLNPYYRVD